MVELPARRNSCVVLTSGEEDDSSERQYSKSHWEKVRLRHRSSILGQAVAPLSRAGSKTMLLVVEEALFEKRAASKVQKAIAANQKLPKWLADHILRQGTSHMQLTFAKADSNHDRVLQRAEFYAFLRTYFSYNSPISLTESQLRRMYDDASNNQTRELTFKAIVEWITEAQRYGVSFLEDDNKKKSKEQMRSSPSRRRARALLDNKVDHHFLQLPPI